MFPGNTGTGVRIRKTLRVRTIDRDPDRLCQSNRQRATTTRRRGIIVNDDKMEAKKEVKKDQCVRGEINQKFNF